MIWLLCSGVVLLLSACDCAYGGPGCSNPWALGLCQPVIEQGVPARVEVQYGDDTGFHAAEVMVTRIEEPERVGVWPGNATGSLIMLGLAEGTTGVELQVEGWDSPAVFQLEVIATPPSTCVVDENDDGPRFALEVRPN